MAMKLFDKLSKNNQKAVVKFCDNDTLGKIKSIETFYGLQIIDALMVWQSINPKKDFNYLDFKKLFKQ